MLFAHPLYTVLVIAVTAAVCAILMFFWGLR